MSAPPPDGQRQSNASAVFTASAYSSSAPLRPSTEATISNHFPPNADPERLEKLEKRMYYNGSSSQGHSQDFFEGAAMAQQPVSAPPAPVNPTFSSIQQISDVPANLAVISNNASLESHGSGSSRKRSAESNQSGTSSSRPPRKQSKQRKATPTSQQDTSNGSHTSSHEGSQHSPGSRRTRSATGTASKQVSYADGDDDEEPPLPIKSTARRRHHSPTPKRKNSRGSNSSVPPVQTPHALEEQLLNAREERDRYKRELGDLRVSHMSDMTRFMDTVANLVSSQSRQENKTARDKYLQNVQRLGWTSAVRSGIQVHDVWHNGAAFRDLRQRQKDVERRRKLLEDQKKELSKLRPVKAKKRFDAPGTDDEFQKPSAAHRPAKARLSEQEYGTKLEIIQLGLAQIKAEEEGLKTQQALLVRERNLHVREMKRIADEDSAKYKDLPHRLTDRYLLLSLLGKGGFSEVYKGYDLKECRFVAGKIHQLNTLWSDAKKANYIKHATREYEIHRTLKHESVVELYDVFEIDPNSFCTVLEYCPGNDLDFLLKQEHQLTERDARNKIVQIMNALKYLNSVRPPVIHYDLKPANVLLQDGRVKITDFGLSKQVQDADAEGNMDLTSQGAGTYWYLPPECFVVGTHLPKISSKVDVWSVGIIFYQCLYGEKPFGHNQSQQAILQQNIILNARDIHFPERPKISEDAKHFIRRCLTYEASRRPDVLALCEDHYLRKKL